MAPGELNELKAQPKDILDKGFLRPTISSWGDPVFFVMQKDGCLKMCMDYRQQNIVTIKNSYQIPSNYDLFYQFQGASYFSNIELRLGN